MDDIIDKIKDWFSWVGERGPFGRFFYSIVTGVFIACGLYVTAFVLEFANCVTCGFCPTMCALCVQQVGWDGWGDFLSRPGENTLYNHCGCESGCSPSGPPTGVGACVPIWGGQIFFNVLIFCAIAGAIIGAIYGLATQVQIMSEKRERRRQAESEEYERRVQAEREAEAKRLADAAARDHQMKREAAEALERKRQAESKQRQENAAEFQQKSEYALNQCEKYKRISDNTGLSPDPNAVNLQVELWEKVNETSTALQKLDNIVKELKKENAGT